MDYTNSLDNITDPGTGHRMHQDDQAITTVWSAQDANGINWELMEILKAGGIDPKAFNKDDPESYSTVLKALRAIDYTTRPQFDNTKKAATTEFVTRHGHQFANVFGLSSAQTLTASHCGGLVQLGGASPYTTKLPALSACTLGAEISFWSTNGNVLTISAAGADLIYTPIGTASSTTMMQGDYLTLVAIPGLGWYSASSTSFLGKSAAFGSSLSTNGYQKLPGGLIIQWGEQMCSNLATTSATFPIQFPNNCLQVVLTGQQIGGGVQAYTVLNFYSKTGFSFNAFYAASGTAPAVSTAGGVNAKYFAIGY